MNANIASALADWEFIRQNSTEFIKTLGDEGLKKELPRPGLNTYCKHFQEMISVQTCYVRAVETGKMDFDGVGDNDSFDGMDSVDSLLSKMKIEDEKFKNALSKVEADMTIDWSITDEEPKILSSHIANISIHETLHIGQLVAFSYATGVDIPEFIKEMWA